MQEIFPIMAGVLVGAIVLAIKPAWLKVLVYVGGCVVFGFAASYFTGELEESWNFLSLDMLLVWLGGLVVIAVGTAARLVLAARRT
jgi:hypothetical protein